MKSSQTATVGWALVGVVWGVLVLLAVFFPGAGGHGWVSPLKVAWLALIGVPLATLAWVRERRLFAAIALTIGLAADLFLVWATVREGVHYFNKVFGPSVLWIGVWSSWQILAVIALFRSRGLGDRARDTVPSGTKTPSPRAGRAEG